MEKKTIPKINQNSCFRQHFFDGWQVGNGNYKCETNKY